MCIEKLLVTFTRWVREQEGSWGQLCLTVNGTLGKVSDEGGVGVRGEGVFGDTLGER